jgi:hypothetical protein
MAEMTAAASFPVPHNRPLCHLSEIPKASIRKLLRHAVSADRLLLTGLLTFLLTHDTLAMQHPANRLKR